MKKNLYYILFIGILMTFLAGCQDEGQLSMDSDEPVTVSYQVKVGDDLQSRAIGDGAEMKNLSVMVFDANDTYVLCKDITWPLTDGNGLNLTLLRGDYKVLFWLQSETKPYTINITGDVSVSYGTDGWVGSISDMEKWDAFYAVDILTIDSEAKSKDVILTRPLGQLNWAAQDGFDTSEHQVVVTLSNVATTFHPFNEGANTQDLAENEITFTFNGFTEETLNTDEGAYTYLTCNYLFPATLTATFDLQKTDGTSIKTVEQQGAIAKNQRINMLSSIHLETENNPADDNEGEETTTDDESNDPVVE